MADKAKDSAIIKTISLPDNVWDIVEARQAEWQMSRSATIRRMVLEWQKSQVVPTSRKSEPAMLAA